MSFKEVYFLVQLQNCKILKGRNKILSFIKKGLVIANLFCFWDTTWNKMDGFW